VLVEVKALRGHLEVRSLLLVVGSRTRVALGYPCVEREKDLR